MTGGWRGTVYFWGNESAGPAPRASPAAGYGKTPGVCALAAGLDRKASALSWIGHNVPTHSSQAGFRHPKEAYGKMPRTL